MSELTAKLEELNGENLTRCLSSDTAHSDLDHNIVVLQCDDLLQAGVEFARVTDEPLH